MKEIKQDEDLIKLFTDKVKDKSARIIFNQELTRDMVNAMTDWLNKTDLLEKDFHNEEQKISNLEKYQNLMSGQKQAEMVVQQYIDAKQTVSTSNAANDMVEHYLKGYELLHRIRELVTGQEITYKILYTEGGDLYEADLSLMQILESSENFTWAVNSMKNKLKDNSDISKLISIRLQNTQAKKMVETALSAKISEAEKEKNKIAKIKYPKFWNSLIELRDREGLNIYSYNLGRLYEVYTELTNNSKFTKDHAIKMRSAAKIKQKIIATKGENVKGWQQGDYGLTQLKAVYNSNAGLISGTSLKRQFNNLIKAFSSNQDKKALEDNLIKIFTAPSKKIHSKISMQIKKQAVETIKQAVNELYSNVDKG